MRQAIVSPLVVDELRRRHAQSSRTPYPTAGLVRATDEVAPWVSGQLELAELDASRTRLIEAEVRALRAQISPHFIYNSLGAIASFVRTDPERARELLLEFADFTRYSFRRHGEFTTLAEELRSIERYLLLEQARFGDRLAGDAADRARGAAGRRARSCASSRWSRTPSGTGSRAAPRRGTITIVAQRPRPRVRDHASRTTASARTPSEVRRALAGDAGSDSVGLGNVDERLRHAFGDEYGLVVETAPGAGTQGDRARAEVRRRSLRT